MRSLILCLLVAGVCAAPVPADSAAAAGFPKFTFSVEMFDRICAKMQGEQMKQYVEDWVIDPVCGMDAAGKEEMVNYVNKYHDGDLPQPKNTAEWIEQMKQEAPTFGNIFEKINNEAMDRRSRLTPHVQELMNKWEAAGYEMASPDRATWFQNILGRSKEFFTDTQSLNEEDWASLEKEFPKYVNMYNNCPQMKAFRLLIQNVNQKDLVGDPETMKKLYKMSMGQYMGHQEE